MKAMIRLFSAILFMALSSLTIAAGTGIAAGAIFASLTVLSLIPMPGGAVLMAIQKEIWIDDIVGNLFKANPFMSFAVNADQFVLAGKVVHIPQAGAKSGVTKNRSTLPATVVKRTDTDITFPLDEFSSDPILITNADKYELSYDKRDSVIGESKAAISELVGDWMLRSWSPTAAANIIRTTGAAVLGHYGTGNRKAVTVADVKTAQKVMNKLNISRENRYCQLDADMYDQLTADMTATQYRDFSSALNVAEGVVGKMYGFTFLDSRSTALRYTNAATPVPRDPDATAANDDNAGGLFWQKDQVIRALGDHEMFENVGDPTYYGDIYSALVRAGGRIRRSDGYGVVALVQTATA